MKFVTSQSKRFLTALLSSVLVALSFATTCAAQSDAGGAPLTVYDGGKCGFRDRSGRWVIAPRFRVCSSFEGGMAEVVVGDRRFYMDASGREIEDRNFASNHFSEGRIPVKIGESYGFADAEGRLVVFPRFEYASDFSEGLAPARVGGKWGYIDRTGAFLIAPRFDRADGFSEGLASVCFSTDEPKKSASIANLAGNPVSDAKLFSFEIKEKCGFIDRTGELVIEPRFNEAGKFSGGLAPVYVGAYPRVLGSSDPEAGKWGYVDRAGRVVVPLQYVYAREFSEGLAAVWLGKKWGYIDASGRFVIPPRFASALNFDGGLALVGVGETTIYWPHRGLTVFAVGLKGRYGYVDRTGEFVSDKLTWKGKWKK
jgi:hypothetical protein